MEGNILQRNEVQENWWSLKAAFKCSEFLDIYASQSRISHTSVDIYEMNTLKVPAPSSSSFTDLRPFLSKLLSSYCDKKLLGFRTSYLGK